MFQKSLVCAVLFFALTILPACGSSPADRGAAGETSAQAPARGSTDKVALELFVMSQCPYGKGAEGVVEKIMSVLPESINLKLGFVVDEVEGPEKFHSLHGPEELDLNRVQICVGLIHKERQLGFITTANETLDPWEKTAEELGLNVGEIKSCMSDGRADQVLAQDARRGKKLKVSGSPTLFINGSEYRGMMSSLDIFDEICSRLKSPPKSCAQPPTQLSRTDVNAAGRCDSKPEQSPVDPEMVEKASFTHTVIFSRDAFSDNMDQVIEQTKRLFPNVIIEKISSDDPKGAELIARYKLSRLPAFIFPKAVEKFNNFRQLSGVLLPLGDKTEAYQLDPERLGSNIILNRPAKEGRVDILYTPFGENALTIIMDVLDLLETPEYRELSKRIIFAPAGRIGRTGAVIAQMGSPEVEEMERHLAILSMAPDKFRPYLQARRGNPTGSYWEEFCLEAGLVPEKVKENAKKKSVRDILESNSKLAEEVGAAGDISFLVNNRELAEVIDKDDFRRLLAWVVRETP